MCQKSTISIPLPLVSKPKFLYSIGSLLSKESPLAFLFQQLS